MNAFKVSTTLYHYYIKLIENANFSIDNVIEIDFSMNMPIVAVFCFDIENVKSTLN